MLRLATRSSKLAVAQCEGVAGLLRAAGFEAEPALVDPAEERRRPEGDDKGRFTRGIERALLEGRADIGVHSAKDLPGELPAGLVLAGAPPRANVADAWITPGSVAAGSGKGGPAAARGSMSAEHAGPVSFGGRLAGLGAGATIGTASLRRRSQLLAFREDLVVEELRGNVETRLRLLRERRLDAIVLATAGLERLGLQGMIECEVNPREMLPAPGQGTLALEARQADRGGEAEAEALAAIAAISCRETFATLRAERALGAGLDADCETPIGALATVVAADRLRLEGYVGSEDGGDWVRDRVEGSLADPESLGNTLAERMISAGAREILERG